MAGTLTLTINEICQVIKVPYSLLWRWIKAGYICPKARGQRGRGQAHLFSVQQVIGIAVITAVHKSTGAQPDYIRNTMVEVEKMSDQEIKDWMNGAPSPWQEEETAYAKASVELLLPDPSPLLIDMIERIERVLQYLRAKGNTGAGNRIRPVLLEALPSRQDG